MAVCNRCGSTRIRALTINVPRGDTCRRFATPNVVWGKGQTNRCQESPVAVVVLDLIRAGVRDGVRKYNVQVKIAVEVSDSETSSTFVADALERVGRKLFVDEGTIALVAE